MRLCPLSYSLFYVAFIKTQLTKGGGTEVDNAPLRGRGQPHHDTTHAIAPYTTQSLQVHQQHGIPFSGMLHGT